MPDPSTTPTLLDAGLVIAILTLGLHFVRIVFRFVRELKHQPNTGVPVAVQSETSNVIRIDSTFSDRIEEISRRLRELHDWANRRGEDGNHRWDTSTTLRRLAHLEQMIQALAPVKDIHEAARMSALLVERLREVVADLERLRRS